MRRTIIKTFRLFMIFLCMLLAGCQPQEPICPPPSGTQQYLVYPAPTANVDNDGLENPTPVTLEIGNRTIVVDRVIEGPLCNDSWSGTIYVSCNVQVYPWEDRPTFLDGCNLTLAPGTIVYVANHNNAVYYNGCASCHTSSGNQP